MRRILSLIVVLTLVLGATGLFAASADWKGYYVAKYYNLIRDFKDPASASKESYVFQKLELYPTLKVSNNVAVNAGFFSQNYWGSGRLFGIGTEYPIGTDTGAYAGLVDNNPITVEAGKEDVVLGISSAWATLTFLDGALKIDVGRRKNAKWGTGAFFGTEFTPDRIYIDYRTPFMGGTLIPYFIYELRDMGSSTIIGSATESYTNKKSAKMQQLLFGAIYFAPGKTLIGLVINPNFVGGAWDNNSLVTNTGKQTSALYWAIDLYADHRVVVNEMLSVKPMVEVLYGFGTVDEGTGLTDTFIGLGFVNLKKVSVDVLNFIVKADVVAKNMVTFTPEFGYNKTVKKAKRDEIVYNFWAPNEFCGGEYKIGNIFRGVRGGFSIVYQFLGTDYENKRPGWWYLKGNLQADILGQFVKGLNAYFAYIMAQADGKRIFANLENPAGQDNKIVTEFDAGISYAIDSTTKVGFDFGYAKWGKSGIVGNVTASQIAGTAERTDTFYQVKLEVKF